MGKVASFLPLMGRTRNFGQVRAFCNLIHKAKNILYSGKSNFRCLLSGGADLFFFGKLVISGLAFCAFITFVFHFSYLSAVTISYCSLNLLYFQLLDLGAGNGQVTEVLAEYFKRVSVTEASQVSSSPFAASELNEVFLFFVEGSVL